jgi:hypothetical protein
MKAKGLATLMKVKGQIALMKVKGSDSPDESEGVMP